MTAPIRVYLATLQSNDGARIAVFHAERVHPALVLDNESPENYAKVSLNPRAIVQVKRLKSKTYVRIIDVQEVGEPFFDEAVGTYQSDRNWTAWQSAIIEQGSHTFLSLIGNKLDDFRFICKAKTMFVG